MKKKQSRSPDGSDDRTIYRVLYVVMFALGLAAVFAPQTWAIYSFMLFVALFFALANAVIVIHFIINLAATLVLELLLVWMFLHLSGGKFLWTEILTLVLFSYLVAPATLVFYLLLRRLKPILKVQ